MSALGSDNAQVSANGDGPSMVLKTSGAVFVMGAAARGQLGVEVPLAVTTLGTETPCELCDLHPRLSPTEVTALGTDNAMVAAGQSHAYALKLNRVCKSPSISLPSGLYSSQDDGDIAVDRLTL